MRTVYKLYSPIHLLHSFYQLFMFRRFSVSSTTFFGRVTVHKNVSMHLAKRVVIIIAPQKTILNGDPAKA